METWFLQHDTCWCHERGQHQDQFRHCMYYLFGLRAPFIWAFNPAGSSHQCSRQTASSRNVHRGSLFSGVSYPQRPTVDLWSRDGRILLGKHDSAGLRGPQVVRIYHQSRTESQGWKPHWRRSQREDGLKLFVFRGRPSAEISNVDVCYEFTIPSHVYHPFIRQYTIAYTHISDPPNTVSESQ